MDLSRAFSDLGVTLPELAEFVGQVHSAPLEQKVPLYPLEQGSSHVHGSDQSESSECLYCTKEIVIKEKFSTNPRHCISDLLYFVIHCIVVYGKCFVPVSRSLKILL